MRLFLACTAVLLAVAHALPSGFLFAIVPRSQSYRADIYKIDPNTGSGGIASEYYLQFDFKNYANSATYNPVTKKVYFIGDTLTSNPTPNPVGNFLVSLDETAFDQAQRLYQFNGWLYNVRSDANGKMYGVEEDKEGRLTVTIDTVEDDGGIDPYINTSYQIFAHTAVAIDAKGQRLFMAASMKNSPSSLRLVTSDLAGARIVSEVPFSSLPIAMCFDDATNALYGLFTSGGDTALHRIDASSGQTHQVAIIKGQAKHADCRGGAFFAVGGNTLTTVELGSGVAKSVTLSVRPDLIAFFPTA